MPPSCSWEVRAITALLAKLYAEQMIARQEHCPQGSLPTNLPDLVLGYLNELNRAVSKDRRRGDFEVQRDATILAWECLKNEFRPEPVAIDTAEAALGEDARSRLEYLEDALKIIRTVEPAHDRLLFTLDPLAEYLAALHFVNKNRGDMAFWKDFATRAAAMSTEARPIEGFLLAVRECCLIRHEAGSVLELLDGLRARTG